MDLAISCKQHFAVGPGFHWPVRFPACAAMLDDQNYDGMDKHFDVNLRHRRRPIIFPKRQKPAAERQAGLAGLFAVNPAGASLAWFASLAGLAFMAREPLSTVLEGVSPWDQILNSEYQVY